ncbi:LCP family protein [Geodermatophilus sp. SYSU D01176]
MATEGSAATPHDPHSPPAREAARWTRRSRLLQHVHGAGGRRRRVLLIVLGVLLMGVGASAGVALWGVSHFGGNITRLESAIPTGDRPPAAEAAPDEQPPVTFVLVVTDSGSSGTAQSVSLVRLTGDRRHVQLVSFPLNTWVAAPDRSGTTLEAAYESDRAELVRQMETLTAIRIDHYAELDYVGFRTVTDALGGVDVYVPAPFPGSGGDFRPGVQHLDGAAALAYLRGAPTEAAYDASVARQQQLITALFDALSRADVLGDIGTLTRTLDSLTGALAVDDTLSNADLVGLAWSLREVREPDSIVVPISGSGIEEGTRVQYVDPGRGADLWHHLSTDDLDSHLGAFG